jgi:hypothetical protein
VPRLSFAPHHCNEANDPHPLQNRTDCWHPWAKGLSLLINSIFNGWRMEDVWLDK